MLNTILEAVTRRLGELKNGAVNVYTDAAEQEFLKPYFLVQFTESREVPLSGMRNQRENAMRIQYYPAISEQESRQLYGMCDLLAEQLQYVALADGSLIHGTQKRGEIHDGALHFFVNYNGLSVRTAVLKTPMEEVNVRTSMEKGKEHGK